MNLKHLYYFWQAARHGGVVRAGEAIHLTPQTLSGQIKQLEESLGTSLFAREGRGLELTDAGRLAFDYAEEMFALGAELEQVLRQYPHGRPTEFRVGVSDALPKSLAYRLLRPAVHLDEPVRIVCREWRLDRLLAELALHRLDLVIADTPGMPDVGVRTYSHRLGESGISFLAAPALARRATRAFPDCLAELPLLMPGNDAQIHRKLSAWLDRRKLRPRIAGEFDDSALMTAFGIEGIGVFAAPTAIEDELVGEQPGNLEVLGRVHDLQIEFYALSVDRKLTHPCVLAVTDAARSHFTA